jgi:hypothetical protein
MSEFVQKVEFGTNQFSGTASSITANYSSVQTNTEVIAAPATGVSIYLSDLLVSNGATAGYITIIEDTTSAVVKIQRLNLAVNGGASIQFSNPIKFTSAKNLGVTSSTADDFSITISYFTS